MAERGRKRYPWNIWDPYGSEGSLGDAVEGFLGRAEDEEEKKRQKDRELVETMLLMKRNALQDEQYAFQRRIAEQQERMRAEQHEAVRRAREEDMRRKLEQIERPKRAIGQFWDLMNTGLRLLAHSRPKFAEAIAEFRKAASLISGVLPTISTETQEYRPMMTDMYNLANAYAHICGALVQFNGSGDYMATMNIALTELERAKNTIPTTYAPIKHMCEAFVTEEPRRTTHFRAACDLFPAGADSGAVILILMALTLNRKEKKYDQWIDELYNKLR